MKQLIYIGLLVSMTMLACSEEKSNDLHQVWKITSIQMEGYQQDLLDQMISAGVYYHFKEDGTFDWMMAGNKRTGTYEFDAGSMEITTTEDSGTETSKVSTLTADKMVWEKGPNRMEFEAAEAPQKESAQ